MTKGVWTTIFIALVLGLLFGCGGGGSDAGATTGITNGGNNGGGGNSGGGGNNGGANAGGTGFSQFFLSDNGTTTRNLSDGFSRVWTSLFRVELVGSGGTAVVFDNALGETIDLKLLNDGSVQQFINLARRNITFGSYNRVRVTFGRDLTVFPFGSQTGEAAVYASQYNNGTDLSTVELTLTSPVTINSADPNFVLEFRLRGWTRTGNQVDPVIAVGAETNLGAGQLHTSWTHEGTVSAIAGTAPNRTFTLTDPDGSVFQMTMNQDTTVSNNSGSAGASVANGQTVKARGTYDPTTGRIIVADVQIDDDQLDDGDTEAMGQPLSPDPVAGTFLLVIEQWESGTGFPPQDVCSVITDSGTRFQASDGRLLSQAEAFQILSGASTDAEVTVYGDFNRANNQLTARRIKLQDEGNFGEDAFAIGLVQSRNTAAKTFVLQIDQAGGFPHTPGDDVTIKTTGQTEFATIFGDPLTEAQFYALLTNGADVYAEGTYADGVLTADYCDVDPGQ